jgi:hypothetical protein
MSLSTDTTERMDIHSNELSTVLCNPCPLSDDLGRPYHLVEDLLVDGSESSGTRSLLLVGGSRVSLGFGEDTSLREEDDVFVGKLLLELSGKPGRGNGVHLTIVEWTSITTR